MTDSSKYTDYNGITIKWNPIIQSVLTAVVLGVGALVFDMRSSLIRLEEEYKFTSRFVQELRQKSGDVYTRGEAVRDWQRQSDTNRNFREEIKQIHEFIMRQKYQKQGDFRLNGPSNPD